MLHESMGLVLSLFPGVGLFDRVFEDAGFCVVRGPDRLWGGDVRRFHPPSGIWDGVIGGPPCQDFSTARRADDPPTGEGLELLREFARVVNEASPDWFVMENVPTVPDIAPLVPEYDVQRLHIEQARFVPVRRHRAFQVGMIERTVRAAQRLNGSHLLQVPRPPIIEPNESCVMASDRRPFEVLKQLQGCPRTFSCRASRMRGGGERLVMASRCRWGASSWRRW